MSEVETFSFGVIIGGALLGIAKLIGVACDSMRPYQPTSEYLTSSEREMKLQTLYGKTMAELEHKHLLDEDLKLKGLSEGLQFKSISHTIHTVSMFESFTQVEPMVFVAKEKHGAAWEKIRSNVTLLKEQLQGSQLNSQSLLGMATETESRLHQVTCECHSLLAKVENDLVLNLLGESLKSLNYKIKTTEKSLLAVKGSMAIRTSVQAGQVKLDTTSFPGISCVKEVHKIEKELENRGLFLRRLCENRTGLRKEKVRLIDPFPVLSEREATKENRGPVMKSEQMRFGFQTDQNKGGFVIQRHLQQMALNKIKVK